MFLYPDVSPDKIKIRVVNGTYTNEKVKNSKGENFKGNWAVKPTAVGQNVQVIVSATDAVEKRTTILPMNSGLNLFLLRLQYLAGKSTGNIAKNYCSRTTGCICHHCLILILTLDIRLQDLQFFILIKG